MTVEEHRPHKGNVHCDIFDPSKTPWKKVKDAVMRVEKLAFGPEGAEKKKDMKKWFKDKRNIVVFLMSEQGGLLGYTIGFPFDNPDIPDDIKSGKAAEKSDTVYVYSTAILGQFRGRQLISPLMDKFENEVRSRGYECIERNAAVENGYADSIARHYGDRVLEVRDGTSPIYGPQRFFRIRL